MANETDGRDGCVGSSIVDEVVTISIAFVLLVACLLMGISAKRSLGEQKKQHTLF